MMGRVSYFSCLAMMLMLVMVMPVAEVAAQQWRWPEQAENLQVLPKTITSRELRGTMIGFVQALGVRCSHCHVGQEGQPLSTFDFASDDRPAKEKARVMLRMVQTINSEHMTELGVDAAALTPVTCMTCHRRIAKPQMLETILTEALDNEGVEGMVETYHALRDQHYGSFSYDFSEGTLQRLGYQRAGMQRGDEAVAVFQLNVEMHRTSSSAHFDLGEGYRSTGDTTRAVVFYQKALELDPANQNAVQQLTALQSGQ